MIGHLTQRYDVNATRLCERLLIFLFGIALLYLLLFTDVSPSKFEVAKNVIGDLFPYVTLPGILMVCIVGVSSLWRVILWLLYKPISPLYTDFLPSITVIIPAYNEGRRVRDCIQSVLSSDYPFSKIRVIVVNDGSKDDTLVHILDAVKHDKRVEVITYPKNRGKRHALFEGFKRVTTPIVVTVDSDTILPKTSIRHLISPLVLDETVGAVGGRIEVLNRNDNILTRMLAVRYRIGFDFIRAYQSKLSSVFICPGAFTAYRFDAIRNDLDNWVNQTFLGKPCSNGDDHHLTNIVLRNGYKTLYQSTAVAYTNVPNTYKGLSLMYIRWARSNVRESIVYLGFAWKLLKNIGRLPSFIDAITLIIQIPLRLYLLVFTYSLLIFCPAIILRSIAYSLLYALIHMGIYLKSTKSLDAVYTLLYAVFSLLTLQWIYPFAIITVRRNRWLTR